MNGAIQVLSQCVPPSGQLRTAVSSACLHCVEQDQICAGAAQKAAPEFINSIVASLPYAALLAISLLLLFPEAFSFQSSDQKTEA